MSRADAAVKVPLEMTARAGSGRLHLFACDSEVVLTMPPARAALAAPRGLDFVREIAEWLGRDVGWDLPAPRAVTVTCRFVRELDKDGRTWRRHLLTLRRGRTASTVHLDVARGRARLVATKATRPAALLRLLLEALQEAEPATKATAALVGELHPLPCPAPIDAGAWSEDAFFAASYDRERGEATLWRWDRLDAPPRALAILAGEIHGITPSPDGTALVLTNYHAARPDRCHAPSDHAELVHLDLRSERWRKLALDGAPDALLLPRRPSWSADGARVAFTAMIRPYGAKPSHVTAVVDVASARLVDVPAPPPPGRSPDGRFALDLRGGRLHVHGADARHVVSLADHPGMRHWRATLPDTWLGGHRLVFPSEENTVVLDLATGRLQALARVIVRWVAPSRWQDVAVIGHREGPSWAEVRPHSP